MVLLYLVEIQLVSFGIWARFFREWEISNLIYFVHLTAKKQIIVISSIFQMAQITSYVTAIKKICIDIL